VIKKQAPGGGDAEGLRQVTGGDLHLTQSPKNFKLRGGRSSREKGNRFDRHLVRFFQDHGLASERVPLSGSAGGSYKGDLIVPILGRDRCIEAKHRADGFRELYTWLDQRDILIVKADRQDPLIVIRLRDAIEIAATAERGRP
jgi:Holliday junction resolvase